MPKFNMYQSLHTTVIGPEGKPVELQIRTVEMHKRAEYGIAAHWKYKEGRAAAAAPVKGDDMVWLRQLLDWQKEAADPGEFLDSLRFDLHSTEVFVFTPKGDVVAAGRPARPRSTSRTRCTPRSATAASAPGSTAGSSRWSRCSRTATSSRSSPARPRAPGPSRDWLSFVKSPRARNKIRQWFAKERREDAVEAGKEAISRGDAQAGAAAAAPARRRRAADGRQATCTSPTSRRSTSRSARARSRRSRSSQKRHAGAGRHRGRRRGHRRDRRPDPRAAHAAAPRPTRASSSRA